MTFKDLLSFAGGPLSTFLIIISAPYLDPMSTNAWYVIAIASWMVIWWISEVVPLYVTAILPMILFPLTGIFQVEEAMAPYAHPIIFLFLGGFLIALAMEEHDLHKRVALNLIRMTGTGPRGVVTGFMISTAVISMWISNTATTVMMLPIAMSVLNLLKGRQRSEVFRPVALAVLLGVAYGANIGGTATLIGTPPNVVFAGLIKDHTGYTIDFSRWLMIGLPFAIIMLWITRAFLTYKLPSRTGSENIQLQRLINEEIKQLGPFTANELYVLIIFSSTAFLWILRQPINDFLGREVLEDAVISMGGGLLMFLFPAKGPRKFLLQSEDIQKLPWGILLLFGGGLCLAKALQATGIIQVIGDEVSKLPEVEMWVLILILTLFMIFMTELMSNVALTNVFIPVVIGISQGLDLNSLYLAIPVTLAASCAFMMPVSTPPNAIVFAGGYIKVKEMMRAGIFLNLIAILILLAVGTFLVPLIF